MDNGLPTIGDEKADSLVNRLLDQTPNWALGAIGSLLALAITLKILGIDFAGPINQVTAAYTSAIERQAAGMLKFDEATKLMESLIDKQRQSLDEMNAQVGSVKDSIKTINDVLEGHESRLIVLEALKHAESKSDKPK